MRADPRATDFNGNTVSDYAYKPWIVERWPAGLGSYHGDLWDSVLQSCGRSDFESLWRGREHLCPYWDDSPWPPLGEGEFDHSIEELSEDSDSRQESSEDSDTDGGGAMIGEVSSEDGEDDETV
ncbi:hypothetical protein DL768_007283 [Monosporascus sp. mg162]|nr:hypothetical protein DL768_007283 [Monosporascus sp. mg162]